MTELKEIKQSSDFDMEGVDMSSTNTGISMQKTEREIKSTDDSFFLDMESDTKLINFDLSKQKHLKSKKLGNTFAFWYKNGEPIIVIGPHCKIILKKGHVLS